MLGENGGHRRDEVLGALAFLDAGEEEDRGRPAWLAGRFALLGAYPVHQPDRAGEGDRRGHRVDVEAFRLGEVQDGVGLAEHLPYAEQVGQFRHRLLGGVDHAVGLHDQRGTGREREEGDGQGHQVAHEMYVDEVRVAHGAAGGAQQGEGGDPADLEHRQHVPGAVEEGRNSLYFPG